jgi:uncharacterized iron-regulated membrane protein
MTLRRLLFWVHLSVGVIIGLVIGFLAVTGSILTFQPQIVAFAEKSAQVASPTQGPCVAPSDLLKNASNYRPGSATSLVLFSDPHRPGEVSFGADSVVLVNSCDGQVIGNGAGKLRGFFSSVRDLHRWVALNGVRHERLRSIKDFCVFAFVFMILSGLVIWFPRKLAWQHLRPAVFFRRDLRGRAREWNWHNVFGFWMATPLAVIALSGTIMAYPWANALLYRAAGDRPTERAETEQRRAKPLPADKFASLDLAIRAAMTQDAKWQSLEMRLPSDKDPNVAFRLDEGDGSDPRQRMQVVLARTDGHVVRVESFSNNSPGRRWRLYARFVHTGEMFGTAGRIVALLACISAFMLVWTGFSLSLRRLASWRRRKASHGNVAGQSKPKSPVQEAARV